LRIRRERDVENLWDGRASADVEVCESSMRIICDFDGTITQQDTTDWVLEALADPAWRELESDWVAGEISAAQCMRRQVALIGGSQEDLHAALDSVRLDPGFIDFLAWAGGHRFPVSIVSDGVDYFIDRILARHGISDIQTVVANQLSGQAGEWGLEQPWSRPGCAARSGVCKCDAAGAAPDGVATTVFVGDGRSDFCVSARADLLFAKGALADYAASRDQAFIPFETFHDVRSALALLVGDAPAAERQVMAV
jgi:2-hydroxy-3-keto-5-methylthiopentenyl-1-phosphate phosphatase